MSQKKTRPPWCHITYAKKLQVGDHIYRRLNSFKALVGYHHGIVTYIPHDYFGEDDLMNKTQVIEMTSKGIKESPLKIFLNGWDCRLVYYNTHKKYEALHASGTCHSEPSSSIDQVMERIKFFQKLLTDENFQTHNNETLYNLFQINCEEFAIYIKAGICRGAKMSQLKNLALNQSRAVELSKNTASTSMMLLNSTPMIKFLGEIMLENVDDLALNAVKNIKSTSYECTKKVIKLSGKGAAIGVAVGVGIEILSTLYSLFKYKKDYKYTKSDLVRDVSRGWAVTVSVTGISLGAAAIGMGWWALLPSIAVGLGLNYLFHRCGWLDRKSQKQKHYKEYGLNAKSTVDDLKKVRRKIRRQIKNERLHPDRWVNDTYKEGKIDWVVLNLCYWLDKTKYLQKKMDKEKQNRLQKFMFCKQFIEWLDEDISNGTVTFDDNAKLKKQEAIGMY